MRGIVVLPFVILFIFGLAWLILPTYVRMCWKTNCLEIELIDNDVNGLIKQAQAGDAAAESSLALRYMTGTGVEQNVGRSFELWRRSAEQGDAGADYALGIGYLTGIHMPRDYVLGYMWLDIAAAQGHGFSPDLLTFLGHLMTKEQVAEAQKMVREWKPKVLASPKSQSLK